MANDKVSYTYDGQVLGIVPRSTKSLMRCV